ncbi:MAG: hypothetical protein R2754_02040 [Microthrixaceae bacterium]
MAVTSVVARPLVDVQVASSDGSPRRLTIYAGAAEASWAKGGSIIARGGVRYPVAFFLPDSLRYVGEPEVVSAEVSLANTSISGGNYASDGPYGAVASAAGVVPDPRDPALRWVRLEFQLMSAAAPMELNYQVRVLAQPEAVGQ